MIALCVTGQPNYPNNKVHGANMGLIWGQQDPGGPHVGPMNLAICVFFSFVFVFSLRYCINSKKLMHILLPPKINTWYEFTVKCCGQGPVLSLL